MVPDYSLKSLAEAIEFDVEDYTPLLVLFLDITYSNLAEISAAVEVSDTETISDNIHNIKGASLNLGLDSISGLVGEMSKLNKAGVFTDIEDRVKQCKMELSKLKNLLESSR